MWCRQGYIFLTALILIGFLYGTGHAAGDGAITIESPKAGEVIKGSSVTVVWKQKKEGEADHVHVIIDGRRQLPVIKASQKTIRIKPGEHEITVQAATKDHKLLETQASIKFKLIE